MTDEIKEETEKAEDKSEKEVEKNRQRILIKS